MLANAIICDPPWRYDKTVGRGAVESLYAQGTMSDDEILALPVDALGHPDDCHLFLWRTKDFAELALRCLRIWGFVLKAELVWVKVSLKSCGSEIKIGPGNWSRNVHEVCLWGVRAGMKPPPTELRPPSVFFAAPSGINSEKPPTIHRTAESLTPSDETHHPVRLEMFPRQFKLFGGWDYWPPSGSDARTTEVQP